MKGFSEIYARVTLETRMFPTPYTLDRRIHKVDGFSERLRGLLSKTQTIRQSRHLIHHHFVISIHAFLDVCEECDVELLDAIMQTNGRTLSKDEYDEACKNDWILSLDGVEKSSKGTIPLFKGSCEVMLDPNHVKLISFLFRDEKPQVNQTSLREEDYQRAFCHLFPNIQQTEALRDDIRRVALCDNPHDESINAVVRKKLPFLMRTCASCHNRGVKLDKCARCKREYYCNAECQRAHWKDHKNVCYL